MPPRLGKGCTDQASVELLGTSGRVSQVSFGPKVMILFLIRLKGSRRGLIAQKREGERRVAEAGGIVRRTRCESTLLLLREGADGGDDGDST